MWHRSELARMRKIGIKEVVVRTCLDEGVCSKCRALDGKRIRIRRSSRMPLPACDRCRCIYEAVMPSLDDGRYDKPWA